jgi:predicted dehydrogenase
VAGRNAGRLRAFCQFGKHRDIEVEDEVTAYAEYANGATGVFITTVAETPGTNRLEITGDRGKVVVEDGKLRYWRLRESETAFNARWQNGFGEPECWEVPSPLRLNAANITSLPPISARHPARRAADCPGS